MQDGRAGCLSREEYLGEEALPSRQSKPTPDYDPSLLEYLEESFARIELYRAEDHDEEKGSLWPVIVLGAALSTCLLFVLSIV